MKVAMHTVTKNNVYFLAVLQSAEQILTEHSMADR